MKGGREGERGRGFASFIIASFPLVCLPPYKHLQSGTEKIKCWPQPTKKKKKEGKEEKTPTHPQGTQSCTPMTVTRGGIRRTLL